MMALLTGLACGLGLGGIYFGALWATVRRIPEARNPGGLVLASYLGRVVIAAFGFYGVVHLGGAPALLSALLGFLIVRQAALRRITTTLADGSRRS
jgi:F1F0 ATPase subunit 2